MKTFSSMSIPDKRLTLEAYAQLSQMFEMVYESSIPLPSIIKENLVRRNHRLHQLIDALESDLLSE